MSDAVEGTAEQKVPDSKSGLLENLQLETNLKWLKDRTIFLSKSGSHSYGTAVATSDMDLRGVAIPPPEYFLGFFHNFEQARWVNQDTVIYDIRKFIKLAMDCNPSILELLFTSPEDWILIHPLMKTIIDQREKFLSTRVKFTFSGYAVSQINKLKASMVRPPERVNPVRAELIQKFGYDTKDAMHVVRLLRMGKEILKGEGVQVRRSDAEELIAIRNGAWSLSDLLGYAEAMEAELNDLYAKSPLPSAPDKIALDALCRDIVQKSFNCEVQMPVMQVGFSVMKYTYPCVIKSNKLYQKEEGV